jgi:hypothetical protein
MNEGDDANQLSLIPLHPSKSQPIKKELRDMGIHAATVYGDLTSICREMQDELAADM